MAEKIDFVIPWVDGNDYAWLEEKSRYNKEILDTTNNVNRYRDMGLLKYWFRAIEKFTPWFNNVFFVTWGHIPEWLNTDCEKLKIIKHSDYIPKEYLPTFSSHTIELNLHRITGLSDKFVYFNDDLFVVKPTEPAYFFQNGLPCDLWRDNINSLNKYSDNVFAHVLLNDRHVIGRNFDKRAFMKKNFSKWFNIKYGKRNLRFLLLSKWPYPADFDDFHTASPFLKSTFEEVWDKEGDWLDKTCKNKFRDMADVNQGVMQLWQIYQGNFIPKSYKDTGIYFDLQEDNTELLKYINDGIKNIICINDTNVNLDYEKATTELREAFEKILPEKSSFEK